MRPFGLPHCQPQGGTRSERPSRLAGRAPRPAPYSITRAGSSPDFAANYPSRRYCITQSFCNHDIRRLITGLCPELCPHGFLRVMRIMQSHSPAPHHRSLSRIILLPRYWMTLGGAQSHASPDFSPNYVFSDSSARCRSHADLQSRYIYFISTYLLSLQYTTFLWLCPAPKADLFLGKN